MRNAKEFCTCRDTQCPLHPINHKNGCDLCIQKNLKLGEIPSCFFNKVGDSSKLSSFYYKDFANLVLSNEPLEKEKKV